MECMTNSCAFVRQTRCLRSGVRHIILILGLVLSSLAAAFTPTQAQIDQFKSMSPSEQQALAESMGVSLPSGMASGESQQKVESKPTVEPRQVKSNTIQKSAKSKKNAALLDPLTYFTLKYRGYRYNDAQAFTNLNREFEVNLGEQLKFQQNKQDYLKPLYGEEDQYFGPLRDRPVFVETTFEQQQYQYFQKNGYKNEVDEETGATGISVDQRCHDLRFENFKSSTNNLQSSSKESGKNTTTTADDAYLAQLEEYCSHQNLYSNKYQNIQSSASKDDDESKYTADSSTLMPFGYDLFAGTPSTFAPATDIPVPANYVIGPGDTIEVQLYGKENSNNQLVVNREGMIQFPEIGPVSVNGLNFGELKDRINQLVGEQMIGVKASVTMGELRSIRIFVLGEAYRPGSYTVSSLATMTNALFASGGIETIGSLRTIQLKRNGEVINTLDLYDLLINGNTSKDKRLLPGDVIFIPPLKKTVAVTGEVRRPAIYELKDETSYADIVKLAGGYDSNAYPAEARVQRVDSQGQRTVMSINLKKQSLNAQNGDILEIPSVLDTLETIVTVSGHVQRPGYSSWKKGMRVRDVIDQVSDLKKNPDLSIALLKREVGDTRRTEFEVFNLGDAIRGDRTANLLLQPRDEIMVFEAGAIDRSFKTKSMTDLLHRQLQGGAHAPTIFMTGAVRAPGEYPLAQQMTVDQALSLAGHVTSDASRQGIILARMHPTTNAFEFKYIDLTQGPSSELLLPRDEIIVLPKAGAAEERALILKPVMDALAQQSLYGVATPLVTISGAVQYPGEYPLVDRANVEKLIAIAGGLREEAYKLSAELSRINIASGRDSYEVVHQSVALDEKGGAIPLMSRDQVVVKMVPQWGETIEVTLRGEVQFPGVYPVTKGETISQLIERAGGLTDQADAKGAIFLRESLRQKEQEMLDRLAKKVEEEAAAVAAQKADELGQLGQLDAVTQNLKSQIKETQATGRLVFNLPGILKDKKNVVDVTLKDGDSITIPPYIQEISILGEVNFPTSHLYEKGADAGDYLKKSGGVTSKADKKHAYVISRDGTVRPMYKWKFLFLGMKRNLQAGDTLVVPTDIDRMAPLTIWQKTSQILFQLATTAAALNTVGAF
ncbi:MAG TPA: hypothetical protein DHW71_13710 [Gammaproteobacteria bacterium]|nr:hypothetical protein [Gammaproteobacteria bacterium]